MSVNNRGGGLSPSFFDIQAIERLIGEGMTLTQACDKLGYVRITVKRHIPSWDYKYLVRLVTAIRRVKRGHSIKSCALFAGITPSCFGKRFRKACAEGKRLQRNLERDRLASIMVFYANAGDVSLHQLSKLIGEPESACHRAFRLYTGLGEKSVYGLGSAV